jgi:ferric-dicitrate binding protein FerR (iron transport regulator)
VIDPKQSYDLHVSGVFSSTDPSSLIRFLRSRRDLRVTESASEIRVTKNN